MRQWVIGAILGFGLVVGLLAFLGQKEAGELPPNSPPPAQLEKTSQETPQPVVPALQVRPIPQKMTLPPGALKNLPIRFPGAKLDAGTPVTP